MNTLVAAARPPAELLLRGVHAIDPNVLLDGRHDVLVREGEIAEIGAPGSIEATPGAQDGILTPPQLLQSQRWPTRFSLSSTPPKVSSR